MILAASKYTDVRRATQARRPVQTSRRPAGGLFLPTLTGSANVLREWFWREMKEGGQLDRYFKREKATLPQAIRTVARLMHGFQQNNKSDFQRKATLPAKLYHRWKDEDKDFFDDDNNLRSLKRDNPDLPIYVGPRQMPSTTKRYTVSSGQGSSVKSAAPLETSNLKLPTAKP